VSTKLVLALVGVGILVSGCAIFGVAVSPSAAEVKLKAEYNLVDKEPNKILILVEQPPTDTSTSNIRLYISQFAEAMLVTKLKLKQETIIPYQKLSELRDAREDFAMLSPVEVGRALGAEMVLYITVDEFRQAKLGSESFYESILTTRSGLYDVGRGELVWPEDGNLRKIKVGLDMEKGEFDKGASRLAQASVKCVVRYLYNVKKIDSRVPEEVNYNLE